MTDFMKLKLDLLLKKDDTPIELKGVRFPQEKAEYVQHMFNTGKSLSTWNGSEKFIRDFATQFSKKDLTYSTYDGYGRFYTTPYHASYVTCKREIRNFLAKDIYSDLDIAGSSASDLLDLFGHFGIECKALMKYNKNREIYFKKIIELSPNDIDRGSCKVLLTSLLFGGDSDNILFLQLGFDPENIPSFIKGIRSLLKSIKDSRTQLITELKKLDEWKGMKGESDDKFVNIMFHIESRKIRKIYEICKGEGYEVGDIQHDGLFLSNQGQQVNPRKSETIELIKKIKSELKICYGLNVDLKIKPMDDGGLFDGFNVGVKHIHNQYCEPRLRPFNNNVKYTICKGFYGTGKTHQCLQAIEDCGYEKVLWIAPKIVFAQNLVQRSLQNNQNFKLYLDLNKRDWKEDRLICQINSLDKIDPEFEYDCVIVDEIESVLSMLSADIMVRNRKSVCERLESICKNAKRLIFGDNDIGRRTWDLFLDWNIPRDEVCFEDNLYVTNKNNKYAVELNNDHELMWKLKEMLKDGKKCVLFSSTKALLAKMETFMKGHYGETSYLKYLGGGKKKDFDAEKDWNNPDVKLVMYTSTITVGVDFNIPDVFETVFVSAVNHCGSMRAVFQAIHRVRQYKSDTIWYTMRESPFTTQQPLYGLDTVSEIKNMIEMKVKLQLENYSAEKYGDNTRAPNWFQTINLNNQIEQAMTLNHMKEEFDKCLRLSGYKKKTMVEEVPEFDEEVEEKEEKEEVKYEDIVDLTEDEFEVIDFNIRKAKQTEEDWYAWLKHQFKFRPEYGWENSPDLFPLMLKQSGRKLLRNIRYELTHTSAEDMMRAKLNDDYIDFIDKSSLILDQVYKVSDLLEIKNSVCDDNVPIHRFNHPDIYRTINKLQTNKLIPKNQHRDCSVIARVNSLYRSWSGLEFKPTGKKITINGVREKLYQLKGDYCFD